MGESIGLLRPLPSRARQPYLLLRAPQHPRMPARPKTQQHPRPILPQENQREVQLHRPPRAPQSRLSHRQRRQCPLLLLRLVPRLSPTRLPRSVQPRVPRFRPWLHQLPVQQRAQQQLLPPLQRRTHLHQILPTLQQPTHQHQILLCLLQPTHQQLAPQETQRHLQWALDQTLEPQTRKTQQLQPIRLLNNPHQAQHHRPWGMV
mmetsp:Transcript_7347/g.16229  ORF Transcript_7347/g.16229 Transcript_7347/m.16229 type:complete len:204 (+) Transcript_7347:376-987(+)